MRYTSKSLSEELIKIQIILDPKQNMKSIYKYLPYISDKLKSFLFCIWVVYYPNYSKNEQLSLRLRRHRYAFKSMQSKNMEIGPFKEATQHAEELLSYCKLGNFDSGVEKIRNTRTFFRNKFFTPFHAIEIITLINSNLQYRRRFSEKFPQKFNLFEVYKKLGGDFSAYNIYQSLSKIAEWNESDDIIFYESQKLSKYRRKMHIGQIPLSWSDNSIYTTTGKMVPELQNTSLHIFTKILNKFAKKIFDDISSWYGGYEGFGFNLNPNLGNKFYLTMNLNQIISGPVLGPHFHYGSAPFNGRHLPRMSGVFYPFDVDDLGIGENAIEFGRPDFNCNYHPFTWTYLPKAGDVIFFPASLFHNVVRSNIAHNQTRISCNLDFFHIPSSDQAQETNVLE